MNAPLSIDDFTPSEAFSRAFLKDYRWSSPQSKFARNVEAAQLVIKNAWKLNLPELLHELEVAFPDHQFSRSGVHRFIQKIRGFEARWNASQMAFEGC
ncbi:MAG: hypothetical protein AAGI92_10630 [Pseudomonadota bacterium]